ncbi:MAG: sigma-70 family RNA polymerase sigma factor [Gemmataceae bacterium]|nr:sigma-70 family RNA polymerase sigma factor [Gemmataceae bacterium]
MDELSITDLLQRARAEPAELDRLFGQCRNYLAVIARAHIEKRLQAKVDASDLVQQTLLEAYRDFRNFRGGTEAEWLAWLKRILAHNAANFIRHWQTTGKRAAKREVPIGPGDSSMAPRPEPADNGESPSQALLRKERALLVADAVAQLPADYQEVINLRNLQRLPFQDVAERMGRSRPAVQMLWLRALNQLQQILADLTNASQALAVNRHGPR